MSHLVVDCSVTMGWCFDDEASDYTRAALWAVGNGEAVVPSIWTLEVINVLLKAERRKRVTEAESAAFLSQLQELSITVDQELPSNTLMQVLSLARQHRLSAYDAAYLELAIRVRAPLCTLDEQLRAACAAVGVDLFQA